MGVPKSVFLWGQFADVVLESPSIVWALRGQDGTISTVVDTGAGHPEWVSSQHRRFERRTEEEPLTALANAGVDPAKVTHVVLSHLHYDHCGNNALFPNAQFVVQRSEVQYAITPHPVHRSIYEAPAAGYSPGWLTTMSRTRVIDGDTQLVPGIRLLHIPGHSPGMMATLVDTSRGVYALATDHCGLFENWHGSGDFSELPSRTYVDLNDYYHSFSKLRESCDVLLPGHDMRVLDFEVYPNEVGP